MNSRVEACNQARRETVTAPRCARRGLPGCRIVQHVSFWHICNRSPGASRLRDPQRFGTGLWTDGWNSRPPSSAVPSRGGGSASFSLIATVQTLMIRTLSAGVTTAAVAMTMATTVACQSSPEPSADVVTEDGTDQRTTDRSQQHDRHSDDQQSPNDDQPRNSQTSPERSVDHAEESLDGRPPAPTGGDDTSTAQSDVDVPSTPGEVSQETTRQFARVFMALQDLKTEFERRRQATSDPDDIDQLHRQLSRESTDIVESEGLTTEEFNAIADLIKRDDELRDQVQSKVNSLAQ